MDGVLHNNYKFRNQTLNWAGTDSQAAFNENCKTPAKLELLNKLGWTEPDCITYSYNSHGFRDGEFDDRDCGIALGCSHTEGVGIPQQATWPTVLSQLTGFHVWNLGVKGASLDTCFRLLDHWLPVLKPKFLVVCLPPAGRTEIFYHNRPYTLLPGHHPLGALGDYYKVWVTDETNALVSHKKNLLAMEQLCNQRQIPFYYSDHQSMQKKSQQSQARDLRHFGVETQAKFAQQIYNLLPKQGFQ
jgi:hypothetical protein